MHSTKLNIERNTFNNNKKEKTSKHEKEKGTHFNDMMTTKIETQRNIQWHNDEEWNPTTKWLQGVKTKKHSIMTRNRETQKTQI